MRILHVLLWLTSSWALTPPHVQRNRCKRSLAMVSADSTYNTQIPETKTLASHTFAGMVERGMIDKVTRSGKSAEDIQRVLTSWRLLDQDYIHKEYAGPVDKSPEESNCHQYAPSYVPGLTIHEFWDPAEFDWAGKLQAKYNDILEEFTRVLTSDELVEKGNNVWSGALTEDASSYGEGWKTLVLMDRGIWDPINVNIFPKTAQAVRDAGVPAVEVFFASMKPNSEIKLHSDFTNFVLTSHLPLVIPENGDNKCRLTIGDTTRQWLNGEVMVFDTSLMHDAINESNETRYILMMRVWHSDLTPVERDALQYIYDCLQFPELVTTEDAGERFMMERQVQAMHSFPEIKRKTTQGFGAGSSSGKAKKNKRQKKGKGAAKGFGS